MGDFALKLFVLRFFKSLPPLEALPPGGVAAARDFDRRAVDGQDMVDARVEHLPVVRDEDEAALAAQIRRDGLARGGVEMVRRLVDKQEPAFVQEQRSQQRFRLFAAGERIERARKRAGIDVQQRKLALQPPVFRLGADGAQRVRRPAGRLGDGVGEVIEPHRGGNAPFIRELALQKAQQRRLAPAVAADKAETPVGVHAKARIIENGIVTARIGESEMFNGYQRHRPSQ